jgi:hypothetical protein
VFPEIYAACFNQFSAYHESMRRQTAQEKLKHIYYNQNIKIRSVIVSSNKYTRGQPYYAYPEKYWPWEETQARGPESEI